MFGQQFAFGRQDDVGRFLLHPFFYERHRDAGQVGAERLKAHQQRALDRAEEPGHALHVEDVDELVGGPVGAARAERLVGELRERRLVVRRLDHAIELGLLPALLRRLQLASVTAELASQMDGLLDFERAGKRVSGRRSPSRAWIACLKMV